MPLFPDSGLMFLSCLLSQWNKSRTMKAFTWLLVPYFFYLKLFKTKTYFIVNNIIQKYLEYLSFFKDILLFTGCADIFCICYWTHDYFQKVLKRDQNKRTVLIALLITCFEMKQNTFLIITASAGKQSTAHLTEKETRALHPDINGLLGEGWRGRSSRKGRNWGRSVSFLTSSQYQRICKQTILTSRLSFFLQDGHDNALTIFLNMLVLWTK